MNAWTTRPARRSDPGGNATGDTSGYALQPPCQCRHSRAVHAIRPDRSRGACSAGGCGCRRYEPEEVDRDDGREAV